MGEEVAQEESLLKKALMLRTDIGRTYGKDLEIEKEIILAEISIDNEIKTLLDYSMSVIVSRAIQM